MAKLFACYLVDVRNDGTSTKNKLKWRRQVVKQDVPVSELIKIGEQMLTESPNYDRITIMGSGKKKGPVWLYDSSNKIEIRKFG